MFTGIIEELGTVTDVTHRTDAVRLAIASADAVADAAIGDSIAVNGVCLTAVELTDAGFVVDVIPETVARTGLAGVAVGDKVNLERPTQIGGRLDGHLVQGHVDGVGRIASIDHDVDGGVTMTISIPAGLDRYLVEKGSITVDGVSLTVSGVNAETFQVALIPHTLAVTTLGRRQAGDQVNLEVDIIAKYVARQMETYRS